MPSNVSRSAANAALVSVTVTVYAFTVPSVNAAFRCAAVSVINATVTAPLVISATASACTAVTGAVSVTASLFKPVIVPAKFALYAASTSACVPVKVVAAEAFTATVVLASSAFSAAASSDVSVTVTLYALPVPLKVLKLATKPEVRLAVTTPVVTPSIVLASVTETTSLKVTFSLPRPVTSPAPAAYTAATAACVPVSVVTESAFTATVVLPYSAVSAVAETVASPTVML